MSEVDPLADLLNTVFEGMRAPAGAPGPFVVTDAASANWTLVKLAAINAAEYDDGATVAKLINDIDTWRIAREKGYAADRAYFEGLLREWHAARLIEDPELKTITLPAGELQVRSQPAKWDRKEPIILDWLEEQEIHTFTKKDLAWAEFKKQTEVREGVAYYRPTGERVPSVSVVDVPDKFSAKASGA